jgi:hypothetical protein
LAVSVPQTLEIVAKDVTAPNVVNIHVKHASPITTDLVFTYGKCDSVSLDDAHHLIAKVHGDDITGDDTRLVWVVPDDVFSGGCVSAWEQKHIVGQSAPLSLASIIHAGLSKRDMIPMTNDSGIDAEGPWFNGVTLLKNKEIGAVDAKKAKSKCQYNSGLVNLSVFSDLNLAIGIIGAGISGLMTYVRAEQGLRDTSTDW